MPSDLDRWLWGYVGFLFVVLVIYAWVWTRIELETRRINRRRRDARQKQAKG